MIARIYADLPRYIDTHGFRFRLDMRFGIKQMYPIFKDAETTLFVGYFLTEVIVKDKKKNRVFKNSGVWTCKRLAEKQRIHEFTDALIAIPLMDEENNEELFCTLECLARTIVGEVNKVNKLKTLNNGDGKN